MPRSAAEPLEDVRRPVAYVPEDTAGATLDVYLHDRRMQQLTERKFEIIGEAMRRLRALDPAIAARISGRREIIAFRNVVIHGYDSVDYTRVWRIIEGSLPALKAEVEALLKEVAGRRDGEIVGLEV